MHQSTALQKAHRNSRLQPVDGLERTMVISLQDVARIIEASTAGAPDR